MRSGDLHEAAKRLQDESAHLRERSEAVIKMAETTLESVKRSTSENQQIADLVKEVAGLRTAMESRAAIEQAKGIIIATSGCTPEEAFALLVRQSQHENRKLRIVAEQLVARNVRQHEAERPTPPPPGA